MKLINKSFLIIILILGTGIAQSQSILCNVYQDATCVAVSPFSVDNIQQIRSLGGIDGPRLLDATWHDTELIIVMLDDDFTELDDIPDTNSLHYRKIEEIDDRELPQFVASLAKDKSLVQLAVQSNTVAVGTTNGTVMFWDLIQEELLNEVLVSDGEVTELLFHPSGEWLLTVIDHSMLFHIDMESQLVTEIDLQMTSIQPLETLSFSNDGNLLAGTIENSINIWDTNSWEEQDSQELQAESIEGLIFTSDDSHLIVLADATVSRWSVVDDELDFISEFEPHPSKQPCLIKAGDISLDGSLLMTSDECRQDRVWDMSLDTEMFIPSLDYPSGGVWEILQFSPDGRYLLYGSSVYGWVLLFIYQPELSD